MKSIIVIIIILILGLIASIEHLNIKENVTINSYSTKPIKIENKTGDN